MIGRYTRPEMRDIWTEQRKLEIWLEIELLAAEALCGEGLVPMVEKSKFYLPGDFGIRDCIIPSVAWAFLRGDKEIIG